mgnify:CR=1 FL=1
MQWLDTQVPAAADGDAWARTSVVVVPDSPVQRRVRRPRPPPCHAIARGLIYARPHPNPRPPAGNNARAIGSAITILGALATGTLDYALECWVPYLGATARNGFFANAVLKNEVRE